MGYGRLLPCLIFYDTAVEYRSRTLTRRFYERHRTSRLSGADGFGLERSGSGWCATHARLPISKSSQYRFKNWEDLRAQFPLSPQLIHLAAFFLASHPTPVREAIERHRAGLDADPIGYWYEHEEKQEAKVLQAAAEYLGGNPTDIALTDSTTMGLGLLYGGLKLGNEQEILTTTHDHYSTETALRLRAERTGAMVRQIHLYRSTKTVSRDEIVDSLRKGITPMTRIVAVTWVHSSTGLKLPIHEMALAIQAINRSREERDRIIFCVDGVHALGVEDFRVSELGCDFLIAGTHKWMFGPRGTGLVWGHPKAWPIARATIPTFSGQAYELWMENKSPKDLPPSSSHDPRRVPFVRTSMGAG